MHWGAWQATRVHGGHKESDTTKWLVFSHSHFHIKLILKILQMIRKALWILCFAKIKIIIHIILEQEQTTCKACCRSTGEKNKVYLPIPLNIIFLSNSHPPFPSSTCPWRIISPPILCSCRNSSGTHRKFLFLPINSQGLPGDPSPLLCCCFLVLLWLTVSNVES